MKELGIESSSTINSTYEAQDITADEVIRNPRYSPGRPIRHHIAAERKKFASNVLDTQAPQNTI